MIPEEEKELTEHINAIAKILYRQARLKQVETLAQETKKSRKSSMNSVV